MKNKTNRREVLKNLTLASGAIGLGSIMSSFSLLNPKEDIKASALKNNINHSVCRWCFKDIPLDQFASECSKLGIKAIDLLSPEEWETAKKYGLECSMGTAEFAIIEIGFNDPANHKELQENYKGLIDKASVHGVKNLIVFSGNSRGMDDETGMKNCAEGLNPLLDYAAKKKRHSGYGVTQQQSEPSRLSMRSYRMGSSLSQKNWKI